MKGKEIVILPKCPNFEYGINRVTLCVPINPIVVSMLVLIEYMGSIECTLSCYCLLFYRIIQWQIIRNAKIPFEGKLMLM